MTQPSKLTGLVAAAAVLGLVGCGATRRHPPRPAKTAIQTTAHAPRSAQEAPARVPRAPLQALVTAQTENQVLVVDLPSGRVVRRLSVPGDPEYVATSLNGASGTAAVVSARSGSVTLFDLGSLRRVKVFGGFVSPHIPAILDGDYAYVTDDASGKLTVIGLYNDRVVARIEVGAGAHHLAFSPDHQQVWVALGQSARKIAILSTVISRPPPPSSPVGDPGHPHLVARFTPGFRAHDLLFTPDGRQVWVTSADTSDVTVFNPRNRRRLFRVRAGPPPQHVAFDGRFAYLTSGYGSQIELVALNTGQVLRQARAPYGSFDLDAAAGYVVASSLLRGTLAIYSPQLRLLHVRHLAPSTEDVTISRP